MAINLTKGQTIDLRKDANDLDQITIGLGWKVREKKKGAFWGASSVARMRRSSISMRWPFS
jgi:stress response protein SCP2